VVIKVDGVTLSIEEKEAIFDGCQYVGRIVFRVWLISRMRRALVAPTPKLNVFVGRPAIPPGGCVSEDGIHPPNR
jgi:hypothetical protein